MRSLRLTRTYGAALAAALGSFVVPVAAAPPRVDEASAPLPAPLAVASDLAVDDWPLARYLRVGLESNPEIAAARQRLVAAEARVPQLAALPEPQLRYAYFPRPIQTRTGPQRNRIGLTQMLPWFGVLKLKSEVGSREAARRAAAVEARVVALARRIKHAYFDYAYLAEEVRVTRDILDLLFQLEPVVQRKFQAGASQGDLLRVQMEIGRIEDRLQTLLARRPVLSALLSAEVGRRERATLPWPRLEIPEPVTLEGALVRRAVRERNRDLTILAREIEREETEVELARLAGRPSFGLALDYFETGRALDPETPGSGDDPLGLSVMVSLPIWRDKYRGAEVESAARRMDARLRHEDHENRLAAQAERALFALDDADRKMALYRDTLIPRARQTLALTERSYQAGAATILDWIDTERELLEFDRSLYLAAASYEQSLADLEALCGGELP